MSTGTIYKNLDWKGAGFERSKNPEPHRERRIRLLREHPWIRSYFGVDRTTALVTFAVWAAQVLCAYLVGHWMTSASVSLATRLAIFMLSAYLVGTFLAHWLAMTIHETSHNLAFETRSLNKLLALFAGIPLVFPMAMSFHRYHLAHHLHLGKLGIDSDLPTPWEVRTIGSNRLRKFAWLSGLMAFYTFRGLLFSEKPDRWEWANILLHAVAIPLSYIVLGPWAIGYLALSTFFSLSLHPVAAHFIHEHYVFSPGQETYSYYGPINRVAFNVGYHVEHHDFMNIPGSRLPELHRELKAVYGTMASHTSWTGLLLEFIFRKDLGVQSRIVR